MLNAWFTYEISISLPFIFFQGAAAYSAKSWQHKLSFGPIFPVMLSHVSQKTYLLDQVSGSSKSEMRFTLYWNYAL